MAILPENNEDLTAFGYDYVRMLSAKEPRFTGPSIKSHLRPHSYINHTHFGQELCFFFSLESMHNM